MSNRLKRLQLNLLVSSKGFLNVFKKPQYLAGFIIISFTAINVVIWALNPELAWFIITEPTITAADKLAFFSSSIQDMFTTFDSAQALGMAVFSVLFGINGAMLVFVIKNKGIKNAAKQSGASGTGLVFAILAGGCVACGTSLLAPLAITLGATSGAVLRDFSVWLNWISSLLILFSIFELGKLSASINIDKK